MRVAALQVTASSDFPSNLQAASSLSAEAAAQGADLIVLPEYFACAGTPAVMRSGAEPLDGPTNAWASATAQRYGVSLVAGSFPERHQDGRITNTSCLFAPDGSLVATYRKIHLFDMALGGVPYAESDTIAPGDTIVTAPLIPDALKAARLGLSVCYDLRFPELFRILALDGATIIVVPAAFTATTGPAHWELLLRARAVENAVFVIGAGQVGALPPGMPRCHGHSMIVDPWGTILAQRSEPSPGVVHAELDLTEVARVRAELPVLANRRPEAYRGLHGNEQTLRH